MGWQFLIIPGWRSPPTSSQTTPEEKWRTGRWSPEGDGGEEEEELLFLTGRFKSCWSLCLVGCFSPSVVTSPYLWPGARFQLQARKWKWIFNFWSQCLVGCFSPVWEHPPTYDREPDLTSCKKVKVNPLWRQFILIFWVCSFDCFYRQYLKRSRLTWKCSSNKPNSERQPLIAVKRDNIKHVWFSQLYLYLPRCIISLEFMYFMDFWSILTFELSYFLTPFNPNRVAL